jgi:hypothetical protein
MSIKSIFRSEFDACVVRVAMAISASSAVLSLSAPVLAQSTNPNSPTLLTTSVISGRGSMDREIVYYYKFTAKPGKLAITLDLDADEQKGNTGAATINLQTTSSDSQSTPMITGSASSGNPSRTFRQIELKSTTPVILVLKLSKGTTAGYGYRVKIDGDRADLPI